ncbi:MAG: efflux RND transporter periplasmic adaptor subunit, partial [Anaerolineales bacterium]|nr:efflux RND transporter periplasmic adaptor subunit [Anaerolineales bacterium]
ELSLPELSAQSEDENAIKASGTVEAVEVVISSEEGGRVSEVFANEGDRVEANAPMFRIEDKLLESQLHQAESAVAVAQANYDLVAAGITTEEKQAAISLAHLELISAELALESLYKNSGVALAQAQQTIATAEKVIDDAERRLRNYTNIAPQADVDQAYANMVLAADELEDAQDDYKDYGENKEIHKTEVWATYFSLQAQAQKDYDSAVRHYNSLLGTGNEVDIAVAEADLAVAQAQLALAQDDYNTLLNGPDPDDVVLAEAQVAFAEAQLALAEADRPTVEELAVAQAQVDSAVTNLEAVQVLIDKLIVTTPISGVVTSRNVEAGELIQPGVAAMNISQLDKLTVTVYISENQYGQVFLGDSAELKVDSFPFQTFEAIVVRIADQAEYTPRNVQTQEERQTTVYAVELSVNDPDGKLKPGMPTDVVFSGR